MNKKTTGIIVILSFILIGYSFKILIVSSFFVSFLESNRISIYYVNDCIFIIIAINLLWQFLNAFVLKKRADGQAFDISSYLLCVIMIFRLFSGYYYPNVPRSEIGYFYKIPEGQTITYPKYPRDIN